MYFSGTYCKSSGVSFISVRYRSLALGLPALMSQFSVVNNWCSMSRLPKLANPTDVEYNSFNFASKATGGKEDAGAEGALPRVA